MPYIRVNVDLSDLDDDDLVDEVISRMDDLPKEESRKLRLALFEFDVEFPSGSLEDEMKKEFLAEVWNDFTAAQLEAKLK